MTQTNIDSSEENLHPCLEGKAICVLPTINPYTIELRKLISAPSDAYEALYLPTLYRFMALCQSMPQNMQTPIPYSLIIRRLELAIAALKLRRGRMMPKNSNSETIAEQEALWTYAVFTTSLLIHIHRIQSDRTVELYKTKHEKLGTWHPIVGSLYEANTYYKVTAEKPILLVDRGALQTELVGKIIPVIALRWLSNTSELFSVWFSALTESLPKHNELIELLQTAAQAINFLLEGETESAVQDEKKADCAAIELSSRQKKELLFQSLLNWLMQQLSNPSNQNLHFLSLQPGFFISTSAVEEFIQQHFSYLSLEKFLAALENLLIKKEGSHLLSYRSIHFENRQVHEGIILKREHLTDTLKSYAIRSDFIHNIHL